MRTIGLRKEVFMATAKEEVEELLGKLPNDCSLEDIQYHLYVLEKVRNGLEVADTDGTVPQEEAEARFSKWLTE
jgi:phosphosulfolactate synthase (CoM biosynthesis protein A)